MASWALRGAAGAGGQRRRRFLFVRGLANPLFDLMGGLAKGHLAQRHQSRLLEEVPHGELRLLRRVHYAAFQAVEQRSRGEVNHDDLFSLLYDPIRYGFADCDAGDLLHLVIEAFQMLNIHGGPHVDAMLEDIKDVFPALTPQ